MPDKKRSLNLDLLHPQGTQEKIYVRFLRWLLSTGRYIVVIVEAVVLVAFISRFKLDADLQNLKESIEGQLPFVQSLRADEVIIRQTQAQLKVVKDIKLNSPDFLQIINKISDQTPTAITLTTINLDSKVAKVEIKINGLSRNNSDINSLIAGLKQIEGFKEVNLVSASLNQGTINFAITLNYELAEGKNL